MYYWNIMYHVILLDAKSITAEGTNISYLACWLPGPFRYCYKISQIWKARELYLESYIRS